jgi:DnaJ-class molecular chaperone
MNMIDNEPEDTEFFSDEPEICEICQGDGLSWDGLGVCPECEGDGEL